jgi:hypothetical protein
VAVAGVAGGRLDRVADGVPEVEDLAAAAVALVLGDDRKLEARAGEDRALVGRRSGRFGRDALPQRAPRDQGRLQHLNPTRAQLRRRQGAEGVGVDDHRRRLVVGADVVLGLGEVHPGLAPVRGVHLRHERGRDLHYGDAPLVGGRAEAYEVPDDPAPERDQMVAARHAGEGQIAPHTLGCGQRLGRLARGNHDQRGQFARGNRMQFADSLVGDAEQPRGGKVERPDTCKALVVQ